MSAADWLPRALGALRPVGMATLSDKSQAQLLDMSFSRLRFSVYMMPLVSMPWMVSVLVWFQ